MHEEDEEHFREGSSGREGARVDHYEVDVGCIDDKAVGNEDEEAAYNDDLVSVIQYFHDAGLLDYVIVEYNNLSN